MSFDFSQRTFFRLEAKYLKYVKLGKKTWHHATKEKYRWHLEYNEQLIKETLQNPHNIKWDKNNPDVYFYVKETERYYVGPNITANLRKFRYLIIVVQKDHRSLRLYILLSIYQEVSKYGHAKSKNRLR